MDECYAGLVESHEDESSIGDVYFHEGSNFYLVPFLHCGVEYLAYFTPVDGGLGGEGVSLDIFSTAIEVNTGHKVSECPYVLKFGLKDNFDTDDLFGVDRKQKIDNLLFTLPSKLAICVQKLMAKTDTNEFYFLAGSKCPEHQRKLNIWYKRVSNKLAAQHGLTPIHQDTEGGWYGYKRNH